MPDRIEVLREKIGHEYDKAREQIDADRRRLVDELDSGVHKAKRSLTLLGCLIHYCENVRASSQPETVDNMLRKLSQGTIPAVDCAGQFIALEFRPTDRRQLMPCHIVGRLMNTIEARAAFTISNESQTWDELNTKLQQLLEVHTKLNDVAKLIDERKAAGNDLAQPVHRSSHVDDPVTYLQCGIVELISTLDQKDQALSEQELAIARLNEELLSMTVTVCELEEVRMKTTVEVRNLTDRLTAAESERDCIKREFRVHMGNFQMQNRNLQNRAEELTSLLKQCEAELSAKLQMQGELERTVSDLKTQLDIASDKTRNLQEITQRQRLHEEKQQQQLRLAVEREAKLRSEMENLKRREYENQRIVHKMTKSKNEAQQELHRLTAVRAGMFLKNATVNLIMYSA